MEEPSREKKHEVLLEMWRIYETWPLENKYTLPNNPPSYEDLCGFYRNCVCSDEFRKKMFRYTGRTLHGYESDREKFKESSDESDSDSSFKREAIECYLKAKAEKGGISDSDTSDDERFVAELNNSFRDHMEKYKSLISKLPASTRDSLIAAIDKLASGCDSVSNIPVNIVTENGKNMPTSSNSTTNSTSLSSTVNQIFQSVQTISEQQLQNRDLSTLVGSSSHMEANHTNKVDAVISKPTPEVVKSPAADNCELNADYVPIIHRSTLADEDSDIPEDLNYFLPDANRFSSSNLLRSTFDDELPSYEVKKEKETYEGKRKAERENSLSPIVRKKKRSKHRASFDSQKQQLKVEDVRKDGSRNSSKYNTKKRRSTLSARNERETIGPVISPSSSRKESTRRPRMRKSPIKGRRITHLDSSDLDSCSSEIEGGKKTDKKKYSNIKSSEEESSEEGKEEDDGSEVSEDSDSLSADSSSSHSSFIVRDDEESESSVTSKEKIEDDEDSQKMSKEVKKKSKGFKRERNRLVDKNDEPIQPGRRSTSNSRKRLSKDIVRVNERQITRMFNEAKSVNRKDKKVRNSMLYVRCDGDDDEAWIYEQRTEVKDYFLYLCQSCQAATTISVGPYAILRSKTGIMKHTPNKHLPNCRRADSFSEL